MGEPGKLIPVGGSYQKLKSFQAAQFWLSSECGARGETAAKFTECTVKLTMQDGESAGVRSSPAAGALPIGLAVVL
jgi:hypothetical protein